MSVFAGIEHVSAEGTYTRYYFEPGKYLVKIDKVYIHEKRLGGKLFIVETTVKKSNNSSIHQGEQRNWVQRIDNEFALPRIKAFIGAALGFCPRRQAKELNKQINTQVCNDAISENNPLSGKELALECLSKTTRAGNSFTQAVWGII